MNLDNYLEKRRKIVDKALLGNLPLAKGPASRLTEAMRYSVLAGGKRIRPIIMLAIADMFNKPLKQVLPASCAVEYIHTSTLILDDLPCMDDSALRRGRLSVHKKFGESTAILASYALVTLAFELLVRNADNISSDSGLAFEVTRLMSKGVGIEGVCAGQYIDLKAGSKKIKPDLLQYLHEHKTADLFTAVCSIAAYLSGADKQEAAALADYGKYAGLTFQIYDDILSITKSDNQLGKQTKKDANSPNFVNLFGHTRAQNKLNFYAKKAQSSLNIFNKKADVLIDIMQYLLHREK